MQSAAVVGVASLNGNSGSFCRCRKVGGVRVNAHPAGFRASLDRRRRLPCLGADQQVRLAGNAPKVALVAGLPELLAGLDGMMKPWFPWHLTVLEEV